MGDSPSRERFLKVAAKVVSNRVGPLDARRTWFHWVERWEAGEDVPLGVYHSACQALKLQPFPRGERHHTINHAA